jgi:hypothetical protein
MLFGNLGVLAYEVLELLYVQQGSFFLLLQVYRATCGCYCEITPFGLH